MNYGCLMEYDGIEGEVNSCNLNNKLCVVNSVRNLQKIENNSNYSALKISYHLGFLFTKLKKLYRSVQHPITALNLKVSRRYVQDKIYLYELLNQFPRLQACNISPNYLKINRKLIIEEAPYRQDIQFWQTK